MIYSCPFLLVVIFFLLCLELRALDHNVLQLTTDSAYDSNSVSADEDADLVSELPGQPQNFSSLQRSGYIHVGHGRKLFYYFVEAENFPEKAPLTLWLNGGPGCSSLGNGALSELGPFFPSKDGRSLTLNPYSWHKSSNLLFLESPAGVGFSHFSSPADNTVGDERTADDAWQFLATFLFEKYPYLAHKELYIAGESYAGHYVPQLVDLILKRNKEPSYVTINLVAMAVGNAWTDTGIDNRGAVDFWWSHSLVSDESYAGIVKNCEFDDVGPFAKNANNLCDLYAFYCFNEMGLGHISIYDIYGDVCTGYKKTVTHFAKQLNGTGVAALSTQALLLSKVSGDACIDDEVELYLNRRDVQEALHVTERPVKWVGCSDTLNYSRADLVSSVLPVYKRLLTSGIRIWIYSGDVDAIVPVTGTRAWLRKLNLPVVAPWRFWIHEKQVGGYVTEYTNLTFVTVRNAGHMVPYTQPGRALHLFKAFLSDGKL